MDKTKSALAFILLATLCVNANVGNYCSEDKKMCIQLKSDGKFVYAADEERFFGTYTVKCEELNLVFDGLDEKPFLEKELESSKRYETAKLNEMIEKKCSGAAFLGVPMEDFNGKRYSLAQVKQCVKDYENVKAVKERRAAIKAMKPDRSRIKDIVEAKNKDFSSATIYGNSIRIRGSVLNNGFATNYLPHKYYCSDGVLKEKENEFTDSRDGKKYKYVTIGKQTWMAENLNYHGKDGYLGLCYYENEPESCESYGRFYDWAEAMGIDRKYNEAKWGSINWPWKKAKNHQGICPDGWHLPSDKEWKTLIDFAGGEKVAGKKLNVKEKGRCKYTTQDDRGRIAEHDECATDEYGFSANYGAISDLNSHMRSNTKGDCFFIPLELDSDVYSATNKDGSEYSPKAHGLCFDKKNWNWNEETRTSTLGISFFDKKNLHPVRCVKD